MRAEDILRAIRDGAEDAGFSNVVTLTDSPAVLDVELPREPGDVAIVVANRLGAPLHGFRLTQMLDEPQTTGEQEVG